MNQLDDFLPYILEHKERTFVCVLTHELLRKKRALEDIVSQLCILHSLNIRLLLVASAHANYTHVSPALGARIALQNARLRTQLERLFSVSTPRSTHGKHPVYLVSGNFATARPRGVVQGVDTQCAGVLRAIDTAAIKRLLDTRAIVLTTTSLYSVLGDMPLVVDWQSIVAALARGMQADKVIVLHADRALASTNEAIGLGDIAKLPLLDHVLVHHAEQLVQQGTKRVHLIYGAHKGVLIQELFSQTGQGILIGKQAFERIEAARVEDLGALLALIRPYEAQGLLTKRQRALLEEDLPRHYYLLKRDKGVVASGALVPFVHAQMAEIACLAVARQAHGKGLGKHMLQFLEARAQEQGFSRVFCLTTQAAHWFVEQGYSETSAETLPSERPANARNSHILVKSLI